MFLNIQMINFCNKIPLYFQDVEVQVAPWNTTKAYMLAMKVSLTQNTYIKNFGRNPKRNRD